LECSIIGDAAVDEQPFDTTLDHDYRVKGGKIVERWLGVLRGPDATPNEALPGTDRD